MPFVKGQSGNPGGRKKESGDLREMARAASPDMLQILINLAKTSASDRSRVTAANAVLDRAYGKPAQTLGDGDGNPVEWIDLLRAARERIDP